MDPSTILLLDVTTGGMILSVESWNAVAAIASALAAGAALAIGCVSLRQSREVALEGRRRSAHALDSAFQSRLDPLYPGLGAVLGSLEDGVPLEVREVLVPFYVLFSDAYAAHRDGLMSDRDWEGMRSELAHWAQRPNAVRAWQAFRQQRWTEGFVEFIDDIHSGPCAYPDLVEHRDPRPTVVWQD
jgi:hypothetical protein